MITNILTEILLGIVAALSDVSRVVIKVFFEKKQILRDDKKKQETLSKKLEKLTNNLQETSALMAEIEMEFQHKKELADKWSKEAETSQIIATMSQKEVEAVTRIFGGVIEQGEKKSYRKSWWWNLFFCFLGIIGGYIASKFL